MEHKQTVTEVKESRLSVKQKVLFGMGDYLNTITYGMISAFLMAFLTDTLLIPMAAVTAIMSLSKLWDAINDPVIGVIIDKSRSPKGVYRPWLIRMMIPFALSNILLWLPIGHWSTSAKITVVSIVYCLYMVFFTAYHIAYGSLGGAMTQNTDDRGSLYGYRLGTSQLLFWLMTVLWLPLINLLMSGGMAQDKAYFTAAIIFTVPGLLFAVLLYRNSWEVVEPQKSTKLPAKDLWHFVIQNGPLLMVMFGQFVCGIYMYGRSGVMMYYFTYYAGNTNLFTIYNLIAIGCGIAGPFTAPILMEKCGNKGRIVALGAIGSGALFVAMNFINAGTNPLLFYIFAGVSGYFNGLIMAAVYACMLDTIEVGQYKTGIRASAFAVSLCHFANKLGMTISTAGVGAVLAALGFAANQTQNGDVLFWINGFFTWVPGVIGIVVGVVFLFYKLNRERYYEILAKLKEKAE